MKLYYNPISTYSQKTLLAFYEKGLEFEPTIVALMDPEAREAYREVYPLGEWGSTTIGELAKPFEMSSPAISRHMKILENAGLIKRRIRGRQHHCNLTTGALKTAEDWINFHREFWEGRLDALDDLLRNQKLF